jgi:hypothetical protein
MGEDTHGLPFEFECRNADGVWRDLYILGCILQILFLAANERVNPSVLAYLGPNAHVELVHNR